MLCDGSPDPTVGGEINTYMNLWKEDDSRMDISSVLQDSLLTLSVSAHIVRHRKAFLMVVDLTLTKYVIIIVEVILLK